MGMSSWNDVPVRRTASKVFSNRKGAAMGRGNTKNSKSAFLKTCLEMLRRKDEEGNANPASAGQIAIALKLTSPNRESYVFEKYKKMVEKLAETDARWERAPKMVKPVTSRQTLEDIASGLVDQFGDDLFDDVE